MTLEPKVLGGEKTIKALTVSPECHLPLGDLTAPTLADPGREQGTADSGLPETDEDSVKGLY